MEISMSKKIAVTGVTKKQNGIRVLHLRRTTTPKTFFAAPVEHQGSPQTEAALSVPSTSAAKPVKFIHTHADGLYHYVYTPATKEREGVLKIRVSVARMEAFRTSRFGSAVEELADVLQQGNGWFEVTSKDLSNLSQESGVRHDGLIVWLREFNRFFVGNVNAGYSKAPVVVAKPRPQIKLVVNKANHRIEAKQVVPVSQDRLDLLVQTINRRFGH
jgi:hypothetical protein